MEQSPINQRLNFLSEALAESVRAFGLEIGENTTNTHKYIKSTTRPSPEFLEKVLVRFRNINARWLLTGEGEPFEGGAVTSSQVNQKVKKNLGNVIGTNNGTMSQLQGSSDDAKKQLEMSHHSVAVLMAQSLERDKLLDEKDKRIEQLQMHLKDKERIIHLYESQHLNP